MEDFNISIIDRLTKKSGDYIKELNNFDVMDICGTLHLTTAHSFCAHLGTFSKIDHTLGGRVNLNKFQRIVTMQCKLQCN